MFLELVFLFVAPPVIDFDQGVTLSRNGDYEASEMILSQIKSYDTKHTFYRLTNNFMLNNKEEAIKLADQIIHDFNEIPQRYRDLAFIMRADMDTWQNERDDLEDISREMNKIKNRLKNNRGGKKTQDLQKDVLARLEKMIKDREDAIENQKKKEDKDKDAEEIQKQIEKIIMPPKDTHNDQEKGTGEAEKKRMREVAEVWGKLQEKERAKVIIELTRLMPSKDKMIIENYLKELQKRSSLKK